MWFASETSHNQREGYVKWLPFMLTDIQKLNFLDITGVEYDSKNKANYIIEGDVHSFKTHHPYNDKNWSLSPWWCSYIIDNDNNLIIELYNRMTNNRVYGWDINGDELSSEITEKIFKRDYPI